MGGLIPLWIGGGMYEPMVVTVVSRIGRSRSWAAWMMARWVVRPLSSISMRIRSSSTMPLLITIPASETTPSRVMKPK